MSSDALVVTSILATSSNALVTSSDGLQPTKGMTSTEHSVIVTTSDGIQKRCQSPLSADPPGSHWAARTHTENVNMPPMQAPPPGPFPTRFGPAKPTRANASREDVRTGRPGVQIAVLQTVQRHHPDTPWDCHICRSIGVVLGVNVGIYGSPMVCLGHDIGNG